LRNCGQYKVRTTALSPWLKRTILFASLFRKLILGEEESETDNQTNKGGADHDKGNTSDVSLGDDSNRASGGHGRGGGDGSGGDGGGGLDGGSGELGGHTGLLDGDRSHGLDSGGLSSSNVQQLVGGADRLTDGHEQHQTDQEAGHATNSRLHQPVLGLLNGVRGVKSGRRRGRAPG